MATAVFTNADITLTLHGGGGGAWNAVGTTWTTVEGDSGVTLNAGATSPLLNVQGHLNDDATIPADIVISSIDVTFDWAVTNAGGAGGTLTSIVDLSAGAGRNTATQVVGTSSGTLSNTYQPGAYSGVGTPTRADLFAMFFGFTFNLPDLTTTSSRVVISNYVVTVKYQNVGVGSWIVRCGNMTNPTGATNGASLPDVVDVTGALAVGGIDLPIADTAGAFIYVDGVTNPPVAIAVLPTGFVPADAYAFNHSTLIFSLTGQIEYELPTIFDFTHTGATLPQYAGIGGVGGDEELTGMDLTVLGSLIGDTITATMTDSAAGNGVFVQNATAFAVDVSAFLVGTYVIATVTSLTPDEGTVSGGTLVTITGTNLDAVTAVNFDGTPATDVAVTTNGLYVTCRTPAHVAATVDVEVVGVGTLVASYTYLHISEITPTKGTVNGGTLVTIKGVGLLTATGVTFDGISAVIKTQTDIKITVLTPAHAVGLVDVELVGLETKVDAYTYVDAIGPITIPPMPVLSPIGQKGQP